MKLTRNIVCLAVYSYGLKYQKMEDLIISYDERKRSLSMR